MDKTFVRISELAKSAGVLASTVRHYTDKGLLTPSMQTDGGHHLYDIAAALKKIRFIQVLCKKGLSLEEVIGELKSRAGRVRVLLIDDEPEIAILIKDIFELYNNPTQNARPERVVDLHVAEDGFTAGKRCSDLLPDAIILDLMLPGLNGFAICRALRADPDLKELAVMAITGYDTSANKEAILSAGADIYLPKPFTRKGFLEAFQRLTTKLGR
ncbi:MAG: response regulator [Elusimicrobiota bacterium]